jgi:hypothetical protein
MCILSPNGGSVSDPLHLNHIVSKGVDEAAHTYPVHTFKMTCVLSYLVLQQPRRLKPEALALTTGRAPQPFAGESRLHSLCLARHVAYITRLDSIAGRTSNIISSSGTNLHHHALERADNATNIGRKTTWHHAGLVPNITPKPHEQITQTPERYTALAQSPLPSQAETYTAHT